MKGPAPDQVVRTKEELLQAMLYRDPDGTIRVGGGYAPEAFMTDELQENIERLIDDDIQKPITISEFEQVGGGRARLMKGPTPLIELLPPEEQEDHLYTEVRTAAGWKFRNDLGRCLEPRGRR